MTGRLPLRNSVERKDIWNKIILNGFECDFSWIKSAQDYIELYQNL